MNKIEEIRDKLNQKKGQLQILENKLAESEKSFQDNRQEYIRTERAQVVIQIVAKKTQEQIKFFIEDLVTSAIHLIIEKMYFFRLEFVPKRNKSEAELFLETEHGHRINPNSSSGGGLCDVISFALRMSLFNLKKGKKNNSIFLDEPFKFLKGRKSKAVELLRKIQKDIGIQFIITSDGRGDDDADRVFEVKQKDLVSSVRMIK